ncbi:Gfo/Idh/MocA family oxidoreductase [Verrucomicrobia bacterium]|nr:Gfo/Idh/MocA family oxidoreductase [Verrucomicrobiota bacterium]
MRNKQSKKNNTDESKSTLTRRNFLGMTAATAASVFSIVPRHVLGGANFTSPSEVIRMAGIGCGSHAAFFFPGMIQETGSRMVALCDVDTEFPKRPVKRTSNLKDYLGVYTNPLFSSAERFQYYQEMFERDDLDIDAVLIATPDHQHMPISIAAMNMGKHVYCEKDLGVNIYEVASGDAAGQS